MKIAWCTPLSRRCGISKYSISVLPALGSLAIVTVFAPRAHDDYECSLPVIELSGGDEDVARLREFDVVVYNCGNNPEFHTEIHRAYEQVPGMVVVHDKRMHGFFHDLWAVLGKDPARYAAMMRYYYGSEGERAAAQVLSGRAGVDSFAEFPLVEPLLWNSTGVIVHSREAAGLVRRYGDLLPTATLPLPFVPPDCSTGSDRQGGVDDAAPLVRDAEAHDDRLLLVSSGGVYEQKRIGSVIEAIAGDRTLREAVRFVVVGGGRAEYIASLRGQVDRHGLRDVVEFTGWVEDSEMYAWLAAADVAVNLRYPSMESSSLSLVEQMYFGKPVVVTDTSYYSELSEEVAIKVPVEGEVDALRTALRGLLEDPDRRSSMGRAAREQAVTLHDPVAYAHAVVDFARRTHGTVGA